MNASTRTKAHAGRGVLALAASAYLGCAFALSWLADPRLAQQLAMGLFWLLWAALGFGLAAWRMRSDATTGSGGPVLAMSVLAVLFAFMPGLSIFRLVPWGGAALLLFTGARIPLLMRRARGLHLLALVVVLCSGAAATHPRADWRLLYFIGPAWVSIALALAWQHSREWPVKARTRWAAVLGFLALAGMLSTLLLAVAPRPLQLWNGEPDRLDLPRLLTPLLPLARLLAPESMPAAAPHGHDPIKSIAAAKKPPATPPAQDDDGLRLRIPRPWVWVALLAAAALGWRCRRGLLSIGMHGLARLLARRQPLRSMRLSAQMLRWRLAWSGYPTRAQETLREQLAGAAGLSEHARARFARAVNLYGQARFGPLGASPGLARDMLDCLGEGERVLRG